MPRLNDEGMEDHKLPRDNFGYSAMNTGDLQATEYTLVAIACDKTGSVAGFEKDLEKAISESIKSCKRSPRADNLMVRFITFDEDVEEVHGFKLLTNCNLADYDNCIKTGGCTGLFDATANSVKALTDYGEKLTADDYSVNAVLVVITDGCDNASKLTANEVKKAFAETLKKEKLESLLSILVGINIQEPSVKDALDRFKNQAGFSQYIDVGDASEKKLARLAQFISHSISSQSQALGSGGSSKPLTF